MKTGNRMSRNRLAALIVPVMVASLTSLASLARAERQPNVLVIMVDDLRPDLGCYGGQALTPNMDKLAARGLRYTNAHAQFPQCMPSRVSFLTGKRVPGFVLMTTSDGFRKRGEPTMPEWFRQHGYRTVSIGKVYHRFDDNKAAWDLLDRGCDDNPFLLATNRQRHVDKMETPRRERMASLENRLRLPPHTEATDQPDEKYQDGEIATRAVEQMRRLASEGVPFFMAVGFHRPHLPWTAPQTYWDLYQPEELSLPANSAFPEKGISRSAGGMHVDFMHYGDPVVHKTFMDVPVADMADYPMLPEADWRKYIHAYLATVSHVDTQVGRLRSALEQTDLARNTVVVLFSDHGFHLGEHKLWAKLTNYRESTHVPLLLAGPGIRPGVIDQPSELVDLYPTLCRLAGLGLPDHLHGDPLPLDPADQDMGEAAFFTNNGSRSIVTSRYLLTLYHRGRPGTPSTAKAEVELYDHAKDPGELRNVADEPAYEVIRHQLLERLRRAKGIQREPEGP